MILNKDHYILYYEKKKFM